MYISETKKKFPFHQILIACLILFLLLTFIESIDLSWKNIIPTFIFMNFHHQSSHGQDQLTCFLNAQQAYQALNVSWFITFGSALFYHRNQSFNTHDVDTGIFIHDLMPIADRLVETFTTDGFRLESTYGSLNNGQEWTFQCPSSKIKFDIFVFYPPLPSDPKSSSFVWWTSMYDGVCNRKRYHKCRLQFSSIELEEITINGTLFRLVPRKFLVEHYGQSWITPMHYDYYESMQFLYNIIDE